jgi:integrase/recombinase XerD
MSSQLRTAAQDYLTMRRALGFKLIAQGRLLMEFIGYCDQQGLDHVRTDAAVDWAVHPPKGGHDQVYQARRLMVVRDFARHLAAIDPATEVPPHDVLPYHQRHAAPHIYTAEQIDTLIAAAEQLRPRLRVATCQTLLGLLAVTGMRISEACKLNDDDIDHDRGVIRIVNSKFNKSRQVLVHASTLNALADYRQQRDALSVTTSCPALLITGHGTRLSPEYARQTFVKLIDATGIGSRPGQRRPRLHDIRHSVAVWTLMDFYRDGGDVQARLPLLSTWLGHIDPKSTYWYLQAVPELLALAAGRLEADHGQEPS